MRHTIKPSDGWEPPRIPPLGDPSDFSGHLDIVMEEIEDSILADDAADILDDHD